MPSGGMRQNLVTSSALDTGNSANADGLADGSGLDGATVPPTDWPNWTKRKPPGARGAEVEAGGPLGPGGTLWAEGGATKFGAATPGGSEEMRGAVGPDGRAEAGGITLRAEAEAGGRALPETNWEKSFSKGAQIWSRMRSRSLLARKSAR